MKDRRSRLKTKKDFSVLIIGAGINGIGTFRDLALQGVDVLLVDRNDFCSGASAASSHMVHGGVRYLENGEFRLVQEAVKERNRLIKNAPHLVFPLATSMPIFHIFSGILNAPLKFLGLLNRPSERGAAVIKIGLTLYDSYTGGSSTVPKHQFLSRQEALSRYPQVNPEISAMAIYYDAAMPSPERIAMEVLHDGMASNPDAVALNYVSAVDAQGDSVTLRDELTGEEHVIQPKLVINAAGPWIDFVNEAMGLPSDFIGGTKGSHIVLDHHELFKAVDGNEFFFENDDGRIVLVYPVLDRVIVGTSDIPIENPDDARCTDEEIDYFFKLINKMFPSVQVDHTDIVFRFSGVRPLPSSDAKTAGQISRDHSNRVIEPAGRFSFPIFNLIGGKWTTFRAFSEQVTDAALDRLGHARQASTANLPIGGGDAYPQSDAERKVWIDNVVRQSEQSPERVEQLLTRYGTAADQIAQYCSAYQNDTPLIDKPDYSTGEIAYLVEHESVARLPDLLLRRTVLAMMGYLTPAMLEQVAAVMAPLLGWRDAELAAEIKATRDLLRDQYRLEWEDHVAE